jgi:hypothetical protein
MKKIMIKEEDRQYEKAQREKDRMKKSLNEIGYRNKEEYVDEVSFYAW